MGFEKTDAVGNTDSESIPYPKLHDWTGTPWTGPDFKYDAQKSKEENNAVFERCYDCAIEFIVSQFLKQNKDPQKTIYVHIFRPWMRRILQTRSMRFDHSLSNPIMPAIASSFFRVCIVVCIT